MGATLVSSNTTIKYSAVVTGSYSGSAVSGTLYTVSANSFAEIDITVVPTSGTFQVLVSGLPVTAAAGNTFTSRTVRVAAAQTVTFTNAGTNAFYVTGVEFINTP